jgi:tol-pal system protein YbgF
MMKPVLPSMSFRLPALLLLVAGAWPAAGQEGEMASRMILELQQMREEVRELRGLVESQAQEIENLKRRQRDQYVDLDRRLSELAGSSAADASAAQPDTATSTGDADPAGVSSPSADTGTAAAAAAESPETADEPVAAPGPEIRAPIDEAPEVATLADPGSGVVRELEEPTAAEQQAYDQAFRALRETRYADAAEGFDRFLRDHPRSSYAPNALYWLGEVYYVTRDFETALEQFTKLQQTYPESSKQPDALLKIGFSHYELGQWDRARAALEQVIADYPGTNYSRLAENRLRTMRLEGNL